MSVKVTEGMLDEGTQIFVVRCRLPLRLRIGVRDHHAHPDPTFGTDRARCC